MQDGLRSVLVMRKSSFALLVPKVYFPFGSFAVGLAVHGYKLRECRNEPRVVLVVVAKMIENVELEVVVFIGVDSDGVDGGLVHFGVCVHDSFPVFVGVWVSVPGLVFPDRSCWEIASTSAEPLDDLLQSVGLFVAPLGFLAGGFGMVDQALHCFVVVVFRVLGTKLYEKLLEFEVGFAVSVDGIEQIVVGRDYAGDASRDAF